MTHRSTQDVRGSMRTYLVSNDRLIQWAVLPF
jgi:hypothetical protein